MQTILGPIENEFSVMDPGLSKGGFNFSHAHKNLELYCTTIMTLIAELLYSSVSSIGTPS